MYVKMSDEEKQLRKEQRKKIKEIQKYEDQLFADKNQKSVKTIEISIEWKKSRMWGSNPHASANVQYTDGSYNKLDKNYTAGGCGYCKESTVIASIFNDFLKYKLYEIEDTKDKKIPYGINLRKYTCKYDVERDNRYYAGGVGTNCYTRIAEYLDAEFIHIASGNTFDAYKFTFTNKEV